MDLLGQRDTFCAGVSCHREPPPDGHQGAGSSTLARALEMLTQLWPHLGRDIPASGAKVASQGQGADGEGVPKTGEGGADHSPPVGRTGAVANARLTSHLVAIVCQAEGPREAAHESVQDAVRP
jgi:hypothetical protein